MTVRLLERYDGCAVLPKPCETLDDVFGVVFDAAKKTLFSPLTSIDRLYRTVELRFFFPFQPENCFASIRISSDKEALLGGPCHKIAVVFRGNITPVNDDLEDGEDVNFLDEKIEQRGAEYSFTKLGSTGRVSGFTERYNWSRVMRDAVEEGLDEATIKNNGQPILFSSSSSLVQ